MARKLAKAKNTEPAKKRRQKAPTDSEGDNTPASTSTRPPRKRAHQVEVEEVGNDPESSEIELVDNTAPEKVSGST
jgi:hypothetical protein